MNTRRLFALTAFASVLASVARRGFLIACPGMADAAADPRDGRAHARQRHRHRVEACFRAGLQADRPDDRDREPVGCVADAGRRRGREGRSRRLHDPGRGIRARRRALDDGKAPHQRANRSDRRRLACECSAGDGRQPGQGIQDGPRLRRRRKGKAGLVHIRLGRTRRRDASCRGAFPAGRGLRGALRAVQGRARSADRNHGGAARFLHVGRQRPRCR